MYIPTYMRTCMVVFLTIYGHSSKYIRTYVNFISLKMSPVQSSVCIIAQTFIGGGGGG